MKSIIQDTIHGVKITIAEGDITRVGTDAIVNAAGPYLVHGGGVALAIARAAAGNPRIYTEISQKAMKEANIDRLTPGQVVVTPGMNLEKIGTKWVIHTIGPVCKGKMTPEKKRQLIDAYLAAILKADELGAKSVAFPLISAGIFGCPKEESLKAFIEAVHNAAMNLKNLRHIILLIYGDSSWVRQTLSA